MSKQEFCKWWLCCVLLAGVLAASPGRLNAQQINGRRVYDEELRVQLDKQIPQAREIGLEAGGWFNFALFNYDDNVARKVRTLRQYELRGWVNLNIRGVHQLYVRGLVGYDDWNLGTNPDGETGDEFVNPEIERAWYQFDLGQLLQNQTGQRPPVAFRFKVGRAFADIGTALVLSMPLDMLQFDLTVGDWEFMALLGKTLSNTQNIDDSDRVSDQQDRCFWGFQLAYTGLDHHRPFAYFLGNEDHTSPQPSDPLQAYEYTSRYVGIGSEGSLIWPDLHYQAEIVGEWGKTFGDGATAGRDDIEAMALDVLLEYLFQMATHPKVSFEYLFATGDSDRRLSATSTVGGNRIGTTDHAFNAFGFRDLGLSFAPRLSNINVYIVGASFFPFEQHKLFRKMEVGTKAFFYHKATAGPISDTGATKDSKCLGWEWDIFCDWRLTSDLTWTIRYGAFQPGEAFEDRSCTYFLLTGVTLSF